MIHHLIFLENINVGIPLNLNITFPGPYNNRRKPYKFRLSGKSSIEAAIFKHSRRFGECDSGQK